MILVIWTETLQTLAPQKDKIRGTFSRTQEAAAGQETAAAQTLLLGFARD